VRRKLVSPSGREVVVDVPVYPPFRLPTEEERKQSETASGRANGSASGSGAPGSGLDGDPEDDQAESSAAS
jgi:hypothetical protein